MAGDYPELSPREFYLQLGSNSWCRESEVFWLNERSEYIYEPEVDKALEWDVRATNTWSQSNRQAWHYVAVRLRRRPTPTGMRVVFPASQSFDVRQPRAIEKGEESPPQ